MIQIAIDTSVLIGLLDPKDVWHEPSVALKQALKEQNANIAIFDCVLTEAVSVMARRIHEQRRLTDMNEFLSRIENYYPVDDILWILPDVAVLYRQVLDLVRSFGGKLNFNDALITLSCRYRKIPMIASFDRDFDHLEWLQRISQLRIYSDAG